MPSSKLDEIKDRIQHLMVDIRDERENLQNGFFKIDSSEKVPPEIQKNKMPKNVKTLKGHFGAVYALHWAGM